MTYQIQQIHTSKRFNGRAGFLPRWIINHGTAGFNTAPDVANYFLSADVSSNYVIGRDGTIIECVPPTDAAWGNGVLEAGHDPWWEENINPNYLTISIEHVKPHTDNSDTLTAAQQAASFWLIQKLCNDWDIPMREADAQGGITGHYSISALSRQNCPGPYPWAALWKFLQNGDNDMPKPIAITDATVAKYFEQAGTDRWRCKINGFYIIGSVLKFYCVFGGSGFNGLTHLGLPLMNELYPVKGLGSSYQRFERGIVAYDPTHHWDKAPGSGDVYVMHMDKPLPGQKTT